MKTIIQKLGMLVAVLCSFLSTYAYDFEVDGIFYSVISLQDLTCEVVTGEVEYAGDIVIPSEVTYNNRNLSVKAIGKDAFKACETLISVTIPNSVTEIGEDAFSQCRSLTSITIPNSVTEIKRGTFNVCSSLTSVTIPNSVTEIGSRAFGDCNSLTSITIPNSVTKIASYTFFRCRSLTSITIPNSVTKIEEAAFYGCISLTSITIPDSVTEIVRGAFSDCSSLVIIKLSDSLEEINYGLFGGCESLEGLNIPGSVKCIYQNYNNYWEYATFRECFNLKTLRIECSSEVLEAIYYNSSYHYGWNDWTARIEVLYIDRTLETSIPVPNLEKLELGDSIQIVQVDDMKNMDNLKTIESHALVPPKLQEMSNAQYMNVNVFVPEEALEAYKADEEWGKFWNLQGAGVDGVRIDSKKEVIGRYDLNGRAVSEDYNGFVIVRFSDGSCKKMLNR